MHRTIVGGEPPSLCAPPPLDELELEQHCQKTGSCTWSNKNRMDYISIEFDLTNCLLCHAKQNICVPGQPRLHAATGLTLARCQLLHRQPNVDSTLIGHYTVWLVPCWYTASAYMLASTRRPSKILTGKPTLSPSLHDIIGFVRQLVFIVND